MTDRASDRSSSPADGGKDAIIGEVLANRYQIETRLGEGAMGAVYKAKHVKVGRAFAVKVLHSKLLEDTKVAQRFEREAELAGRLRHPNVVGVVDVGDTADGLRYMVMDFANGPDLASLLSEAPMPGPRVVNMTRQLLEGLYHAHEAGLIHRDFKPENVIVEKDAHGVEVPRIVDFGIAILREGGSGPDGQGRLTTNGLVLGTPHYMAPEQAVADPIDHRIDLFALGIVIYEMLCGKLPFDGTGAEVARANLLLDPPLISQRVPHLEVDPLLEAFARRLMAKKRDARPPTAKAARELLDLIEKDRNAAAAALGVPLAAVREPTVTAPSRPQQRHAGNPNDTFPPPMSAEPDDQRMIRTDPVRGVAPELDDEVIEPRKNRTMIFAGVGVGVAAVIAIVILATGGNKDEPAKTVEPTVAIEPKVEPRVEPKVEPTVEPIARPAQPENAVTQTVDAAVEEVAAIPDAGAEVAKVTPKVTPKVPPKTTPKTKDPKGEPKVTTHVTPKVETAPAKLDSNKVAAQYTAIGKRLGAMGVNADPNWWVLYRRIKINEAMRSPALLEEAATLLAKIQREIAERDKK